MKYLEGQASIKKGSTWFLRLAIVGIGAFILLLCIFALPSLWSGAPKEYPNHDDVTRAIRGIVIVMYATTIPFYAALFQGIKILGFIDANKAFSELSVTALKRIMYCAIAITVMYIPAAPMFYIWAEHADAPGIIPIGMSFAAGSLIIAVFSAVVQRLLREAIAMKSENDLTV